MITHLDNISNIKKGDESIMAIINCTGKTISAFGTFFRGTETFVAKLYASHSKGKDKNFRGYKVYHGPIDVIIKGLPRSAKDADGKDNIYIVTKDVFYAAKLAGRNDVCYISATTDEDGENCICIVRDINVEQIITFEDMYEKENNHGKDVKENG